MTTYDADVMSAKKLSRFGFLVGLVLPLRLLRENQHQNFVFRAKILPVA